MRLSQFVLLTGQAVHRMTKQQFSQVAKDMAAHKNLDPELIKDMAVSFMASPNSAFQLLGKRLAAIKIKGKKPKTRSNALARAFKKAIQIPVPTLIKFPSPWKASGSAPTDASYTLISKKFRLPEYHAQRWREDFHAVGYVNMEPEGIPGYDVHIMWTHEFKVAPHGILKDYYAKGSENFAPHVATAGAVGLLRFLEMAPFINSLVRKIAQAA